jgi:hypothetical protein
MPTIYDVAISMVPSNEQVGYMHYMQCKAKNTDINYISQAAGVEYNMHNL